MRSAVNFVRGAVAKNDAIPILTHIHVYDGRIQASNGRIVIDAPASKLDNMTFTCPVKEFLLAIDNCEAEPELSVKDKKLTVKSGKFKASLSTLPEEYPVVSVDKSKIIPAEIKFLSVLRKLQPFISTDSNRPWSCGIFFDGNAAYATNNVVMVTAPCDNIGTINLSEACVDELLRIGKDPSGMITDENSVTFFYDDGAWLKANTLSTSWPDCSSFIPNEINGIELIPRIKTNINKIALFTGKDNKLHIGKHGISTLDEEIIISDDFFPEAYFNATQLCNVIKIAEQIDFEKYPKPCPFFGDDVRGVIIGVMP